jgi:hypothetical protein
MKKKNLLLTAIAIFGLATITSAQVPSYVPTSGLVGWWPFNGNANDESGNGNNGSVNGASLTSDRYANSNSAFNFNGFSDYISVLDNPSLSVSNVSISAWYYAYDYGSAGQLWQGHIVSKREVSGWGNSFQLALESTTPTNGIWATYTIGGNGWVAYNSNVNLVSNEWINITYTHDNNFAKLYLNGILVATTNVTSGLSFNNLPMWFGARPLAGGNSSFFNGKLDDIGIWNRALDSCEIKDLYYASLGNCCNITVNSQPNSQTININNNAQFIAGSSDPSSTFQWQTDLGLGFQNLNSVGQYSGTTNDTLTIANVTMSNNNQPFRCIVSSGSCSDTSNVAILTVNNNVGINEFTQDNLFSVYPNPAKSQINVKADAKLLGSIYTVYDNTGKLVLSGKIISENTTIELGNLSGGIYLFSVGENLKQTFKVIKE